MTTPESIPRQTVRALGFIAVLVAAACGVGALANAGLQSLERRHLASAEYAPAPDGMVFVPAGYFLKGTDAPDAPHDEQSDRVFLPAFYIDRYEVTNADYARFDPSHEYPATQADWPVVKRTVQDAAAYAAWAGKRLPTADEWEKAARGTDGRRYPWGDDFDRSRANAGGADSLMAVGMHPEGASPYGAEDMAGNAWEWVSDIYVDAKRLGIESDTVRTVIRGGGFSYSPFQCRAANTGYESLTSTCNDIGFRCAKDAAPLDR